jgi:bifunctional UDP-N-acetylglucosamine pyrophosphorylase/glucosamine-1-phosphate N-acetyltransferase
LIHPTAIVYPACEIDATAFIGPFSVIGKPYRPMTNQAYDIDEPTKISKGSHVGAHVIIGQGTEVRSNCVVDDGCTLECEVLAEARSLFIYRAYVSNEATIGAGAIIGGFICERASVGAGARVFGQLVHKQLDTTLGWDDSEEESPVVGEGAFVGFNATVAGSVQIGEFAYVCSGAIVTRDVPPRTIAHGINKHSSPDQWKGPLSRSAALRGVNFG